MEKDTKKQDKRPKRNKTVVIINPDLIFKGYMLPEKTIDKLLESINKTYK